VLEDRQAAVMRQVFVQAHAGAALAQDARQRRLPDLAIGSRRKSSPFSSKPEQSASWRFS
jgi:hypothetical protein